MHLFFLLFDELSALFIISQKLLPTLSNIFSCFLTIYWNISTRSTLFLTRFVHRQSPETCLHSMIIFNFECKIRCINDTICIITAYINNCSNMAASFLFYDMQMITEVISEIPVVNSAE